MLARNSTIGCSTGLFAVVFVASLRLGPQAKAQSSTLGSWAGPWDYTAQLGTTIGCAFDEFSHAALIPRGQHAGKVLLWKEECGSVTTTQVWVVDPANPDRVIRAPNVNLVSDIFCAGQSWDALGRLVIAGGFNGSHTLTPDQVYRFDPAGLGSVIYTVPSPG